MLPVTKTYKRDKMTGNVKKPGRPRKHKTAAARIKHYRNQKLAEGRRIDVYIGTQASWRLTALSQAWNCSMSKAIERLLMEADGAYEKTLFPETNIKS